MRLVKLVALVVAVVTALGAALAAFVFKAKLIGLLRERHSTVFTELGMPSPAPWLTEPLSLLRKQDVAQYRLRRWVRTREYVGLNDPDVIRAAGWYRSAIIVELVAFALGCAAVLGAKLNLW